MRRSATAVPRYFLRTPTAPYGVEPLPKELAASQTFGYYDAPTASKPYGHYLYNAWHPERTSAPARSSVTSSFPAIRWVGAANAMQFMRDNLTIGEAQIESETLRYSTDIPGQALAYKTGELTMLQLRDHARKELGTKFDIRQFHAWILDSGAMTLHTLSEHVDYEIAKAKGT